MTRDILIIDQFIATRRLVKNHLRAELSDCQVHEVASLEEGIPFIQNKRVHLVILSDHLPGVEHALRPNTPASSFLRFSFDLPTLILLNTDQTARTARLQNMGFHQVLLMPCTGQQLAKKVEEMLPARSLRQSPRFHMPDTLATLHLGEHTLPAQVVNISRHGMLCEITLPTEPRELAHLLAITLVVEEILLTHVTLHVPNIPREKLPCRIVGLKIMEWQENQIPLILRLEIMVLSPYPAALEEAAQRHLLQGT